MLWRGPCGVTVGEGFINAWLATSAVTAASEIEPSVDLSLLGIVNEED